MTQDIVTRLRQEFLVIHILNNAKGCDYEMFSQAADEIERLRKCLQHAIDHIDKWGLFTADEKKNLIDEYREAVRGG